MERVGLRLQLRRAQAQAGDMVLPYGDESEALTPGAFASRNADPTSPMPGPNAVRTFGCKRRGRRARPIGAEIDHGWDI